MPMIHTCDVMVCQDCYLAYHGYNDHLDENGLTREGNEPLVYIPWPAHLADNTCSNHEVEDTYDADGDRDGGTTTCPHCGNDGHDNGIEEFSWRRCEGCGTTLGGERHRLAIFDHPDQP